MTRHQLRAVLVAAGGVGVIALVAALVFTSQPSHKSEKLPVIQVMGALGSAVEKVYPLNHKFCPQIACFGAIVTYNPSSFDNTGDITGPQFFGASTGGARSEILNPSKKINYYSQRLPKGLNLSQAIQQTLKYLPTDFRVSNQSKVTSKLGTCEIVGGTSASIARDTSLNDPHGYISIEFASSKPFSLGSKRFYSLDKAQLALWRWDSSTGC